MFEETCIPCANTCVLSGRCAFPETQQNHCNVGGDAGVHGPGASRGPPVQQICRFVCLWDTLVGGEAELRDSCVYDVRGFDPVPCDSFGNTINSSSPQPFNRTLPYERDE